MQWRERSMQHMAVFIGGMLLGLGLIGPIGSINVFVLGQGLRAGLRRSLPAIACIAVNDTAVILLGAAGAMAAGDMIDSFRLPMLVIGALYLTVLGIRLYGSGAIAVSLDDTTAVPLRRTLLLCSGVVWLNPHTFLDAFGVLGNAISAQPDGQRMWFAAGIIAASWLWYFALASGAGALRTRLSVGVLGAFNKGSALILLAVAALFWFELATW